MGWEEGRGRVEGGVEDEEMILATECNGCGKVLMIGKDEYLSILEENGNTIEPKAYCSECQAKKREFMFVFEDLLPIEGWRVFKLLDRYSPVSMDGGRLRRWVVVEKICLE